MGDKELINELKFQIEELKTLVKAQTKRADILSEKVEQQTKRNDEQAKKIEQLEKELAKYKNPNTPSSSNQHLKENSRGKKAKKGAKRGAPIGHNGITRILKSLKKIIVDEDKCPKCDSLI